MNTNCTKCGNPLQPGTTICPVCGTNNINTAPAAPAAPAPAQVAPEVAAAVPEAAPAAPVDPAQAGVAPAVHVADPAAQAAAPVDPAQAGVAPAAPVDPAQAGAVPGVAPAGPTIPTATQAVPPAPDGKKAGSKKTLIIIIVAAVAVLAIGVVVFILLNNGGGNEGGSDTPSTPTPTPTTTPTPTRPNATVEANYLDFDTEVPSGWNITTETGILTLYNDDSNVIVMIENLSNGSYLEDVQADEIKANLESGGYSEVSVEQSSVNNQNAFVVNAKMEDLDYNFVFYYIYTPSNDLIVVTVIYMDESAETKYSDTVETIIGSIKYQETERALSDAELYAQHANNASGAVVDNMGGGSGSGSDPFGGSFSGF